MKAAFFWIVGAALFTSWSVLAQGTDRGATLRARIESARSCEELSQVSAELSAIRREAERTQAGLKELERQLPEAQRQADTWVLVDAGVLLSVGTLIIVTNALDFHRELKAGIQIMTPPGIREVLLRSFTNLAVIAAPLPLMEGVRAVYRMDEITRKIRQLREKSALLLEKADLLEGLILERSRRFPGCRIPELD